MENQQTLFNMVETYDLKTVEEDSKNAVKKRFKQLPDQSMDEFEEEIQDEINLEIAYRLRKIAEMYETRALKEQRQTIRLVYNQNGKLTVQE